ncbi:spore maturation protein [Anaerophilus nitritogenes]|uniref:spore maturation protein n=1 Tax=Anaerophilus nitritogenes TaxID=2498136 RepID=UPI00101C7BE3|nr:spore maturation protein [Anaerophilus nitritogenes]
MINLLQFISIMMLPIMITMILGHGMIKKIDIYETFVEGAKEGFKTSIRIMPYLIAIFLAIGIFKDSGALYLLIKIFSPITKALGIPKEVLPLVFMRPVSGSGALGVVSDLLNTYGPDSFIGRVSSTMMGSSETIFYTMAIYFGAIGIKESRHTLLAAIISHIGAVVASVWICKYIF